MSSDIETVIKHCQELARQGTSSVQLLSYLHQEGLTIVESMKAVMEVYGLPLGEAKRLMATHPVWRGVIDAAEPLHDELEHELKREALLDNEG